MKKIVFLLLAVVFTGCNTSKKISSTHISTLEKKLDSLILIKAKVRTDTITEYTDRVIVDQVETEIRVPVDCDSLGRIKPFKFNTKNSAGASMVSIIDNELIINFKTDSIVQELTDRYRSKYVSDSVTLVNTIKESLEASEVSSDDMTITKKDWKIIIILGLIIIGLVYFLFKRKV